MAFAFNKQIDAQGATTSAGTLTVPAGGVASGNLVFVRCAISGGNTLTSITDSRSNTYTVHNTASFAQDGGIVCAFGYSVIGTTLQAADTLTLNLSGFSSLAAAAAAWTGTGITFDQVNDASGTAFANTFDMGSITTTSTALMLGSVAADVNVSFSAAPTGYTANTGVATGFVRAILGAYKIQSGAGAEHPTGTWAASASADSVGCLASFIESGGGPAFSAPPVVRKLQAVSTAAGW